MNRFFTADKIHNGYHFLEEKTIIEIDEDEKITALHPASDIPEERIVFFEGIICPGFVNVHCHLELSHLHHKIPEDTGLVGFLLNVMQHRGNFSDEEKLSALQDAVKECEQNGTVAIGDIANTNDTLPIRENSRLHFHTFVETMGFNNQQAGERFSFSEKIYQNFATQNCSGKILRQSIVPHAPYSVSPDLFKCINDFNPDSLVAIHNEETPAENEYFRYKTGEIKSLYHHLKIDDNYFKPSGKTSLQTYLPYFSSAHHLILVHNTMMEEEDLQLIKKRGNIFLCLCPNANWFIERKLPPINDFIKYGLSVCIGTDSLASNHQLDIFSEIKMIKNYFPNVEWETLLQWATLHGALALQMDSAIGSIEMGKRPGFCLIDSAMKAAKKLELSSLTKI